MERVPVSASIASLGVDLGILSILFSLVYSVGFVQGFHSLQLILTRFHFHIEVLALYVVCATLEGIGF